MPGGSPGRPGACQLAGGWGRGVGETERDARQPTSIRAAGSFMIAADGLADPAHPAHLLLVAGPVTGFEEQGSMVPELGRVRPRGGRELAIHAVPLLPPTARTLQRSSIAAAGRLRRAHSALPGIATGNRHPEISLPAAFRGFGRSRDTEAERGFHGAAFGHPRDDHG